MGADKGMGQYFLPGGYPGQSLLRAGPTTLGPGPRFQGPGRAGLGPGHPGPSLALTLENEKKKKYSIFMYVVLLHEGNNKKK